MLGVTADWKGTALEAGVLVWILTEVGGGLWPREGIKR